MSARLLAQLHKGLWSCEAHETRNPQKIYIFDVIQSHSERAEIRKYYTIPVAIYM